jgi:hypothetical protein
MTGDRSEAGVHRSRAAPSPTPRARPTPRSQVRRSGPESLPPDCDREGSSRPTIQAAPGQDRRRLRRRSCGLTVYSAGRFHVKRLVREQTTSDPTRTPIGPSASFAARPARGRRPTGTMRGGRNNGQVARHRLPEVTVVAMSGRPIVRTVGRVSERSRPPPRFGRPPPHCRGPKRRVRPEAHNGRDRPALRAPAFSPCARRARPLTVDGRRRRPRSRGRRPMPNQKSGRFAGTPTRRGKRGPHGAVARSTWKRWPPSILSSSAARPSCASASG